MYDVDVADDEINAVQLAPSQQECLIPECGILYPIDKTV